MQSTIEAQEDPGPRGEVREEDKKLLPHNLHPTLSSHILQGEGHID